MPVITFGYYCLLQEKAPPKQGAFLISAVVSVIASLRGAPLYARAG